jgi:hypothetical protein
MTHPFRLRIKRAWMNLAMSVCMIRLHEMWPLVLSKGPANLLALVLRYRRERIPLTVDFDNLDIHYRIGNFPDGDIHRKGYTLTMCGWVLSVPIVRYDALSYPMP